MNHQSLTSDLEAVMDGADGGDSISVASSAGVGVVDMNHEREEEHMSKEKQIHDLKNIATKLAEMQYELHGPRYAAQFVQSAEALLVNIMKLVTWMEARLDDDSPEDTPPGSFDDFLAQWVDIKRVGDALMAPVSQKVGSNPSESDVDDAMV